VYRFLRTVWWLLWTLVLFAAVGVGAASVYNLARDDFEVEQRAEAEACGGQGAGCNLQQIFVERGALAETFEFYDARGEKIRVRCTHEHVLVGNDVCEVRDRRAYVLPGGVVPSRPAVKGKDGGAGKPRPAAPAATGTAAPAGERDGGG
jgi:hypothetical protein